MPENILTYVNYDDNRMVYWSCFSIGATATITSAHNARSCEIKATNMKKLFSILFLYITITSITSTYGESSIFLKTPDIFERTNSFIKIEGRIESHDLPDGEILRHNVEIVFSPLDSRLMLFFKRMDIQYKSSDAKIKIGSEKTKYIFDGELWRIYSYSSTQDDKVREVSTLTLVNKIPPKIKEFMLSYTGKALFPNLFPFYKNKINSISVMSILENKPNFPPCNIILDKENIQIKADCDIHQWSCKLSVKNGFPILREYLSQNKGENAFTEKYTFSGETNIINTPVYIPKYMEQEFYLNENKIGYSLKFTVENVSLLPDLDFNTLIEDVPYGWLIIDTIKDISYRKGEPRKR